MTNTAAIRHTHRNRMRTLFIHAAYVCLILAATVASPAWTADATQRPFSGERIRLVVGFGVGGGYDAYARLLVPHLERETGATVIVENWTGGGGIVALNRLSAGRSDVITLMLINGPSATLSQIIGREGVRYDLRELVWLGGIQAEKTVIMAGPRSSFRTLADIVGADETVLWAASSVTTNAASPALISQALNLHSRIIIGYKGSSESSLAVLGGEADLAAMSETSALQQVHKNGLVPIAVVGARSVLLPEVRTVIEQLDLSPEQARWIDFGAGVMEIGRALAASSHISPEHAEYLRRVFEKILTDPEVTREAAARGRPIDFTPASEVKSHIRRLMNELEEPTRSELKDVIVNKHLH
ncbi:tripartite tricarboxylate transporter substrate-binding protein [Pseudomonadota bacterium]